MVPSVGGGGVDRLLLLCYNNLYDSNPLVFHRSTTNGLEDVSRFPDLLNTLIVKHNWTEMQIKKLVGLNVLRVLREVEKVTQKSTFLKSYLRHFKRTY